MIPFIFPVLRPMIPFSSLEYHARTGQLNCFSRVLLTGSGIVSEIGIIAFTTHLLQSLPVF